MSGFTPLTEQSREAIMAVQRNGPFETAYVFHRYEATVRAAEERIAELEQERDAARKDLRRLADACHQRKVHDDWPALEPFIRRAREG